MSRILICDDEIKLSRMLVTALRSAGHQANAAATGQEALRMLGEDEYDVLVTDLRLPDLSGLDVLQEVRARHPRVDVIMITAYATTENAVEALRRGAHDYLIKPFSLDELRLRVDRLLSRRELQAEGQRLREQIAAQNGFSNLVGESARMREVFAQLLQVARTEATVLLLGESGTGKTQLARALHQHSSRKEGPLCEVHCSALPENLLESELFGHERGSFTGAVDQRTGHVERAHRGTLFLDEIGEISSAIQVKLLRFLQDRMPAYVHTGLNLIDVEDVARGHLLAWQKGRTGERYILGNRNLTLKEMLQILAQITGKPAPKFAVPHFIPLAVALMDEMMLARFFGKTPQVSYYSVQMSRHAMYYDATKAVRELGLPQSPIEEAIAKAVHWFRSNGYV